MTPNSGQDFIFGDSTPRGETAGHSISGSRNLYFRQRFGCKETKGKRVWPRFPCLKRPKDKKVPYSSFPDEPMQNKPPLANREEERKKGQPNQDDVNYTIVIDFRRLPEKYVITSSGKTTSWKYHNPGRRFWNCSNSLVPL
ncbi:unnamed protein product [Lactuca virosa]|uniref:Uncharacterized protein n=1 Tax=Lactuca virosa TaxID=75947 RepID=A0AAU9N6Z5_9ASTR|nr:unnamed protein product [Lactuca virosa]